MDDGLQASDILRREEGVQHGAALAVMVMAQRREDRVFEAEAVDEPGVLLALPAAGAAGVDVVVEVGVGDVQLEGRDADDGPVSLVQFDDLEGVLPAEDHVVVEFIPFVCVSISVSIYIPTRAYHRVNAASLGPGNGASGL